jgi:hypothetical protein
MADIKAKLGTAGQTLTMTLASLTNNSARQSTEVDNTSNLYLDALFQLQFKTGGSGATTTGGVEVYAIATADAGTTRTDAAGASDAGITINNAAFLGFIKAGANSTTYKGQVMSVASAFGGVLPAYWIIAVKNVTGTTLSSTEGDHAKVWQGIYAQSS